jgi:hypothetical protein
MSAIQHSFVLFMMMLWLRRMRGGFMGRTVFITGCKPRRRYFSCWQGARPRHSPERYGEGGEQSQRVKEPARATGDSYETSSIDEFIKYVREYEVSIILWLPISFLILR